MAKQEGRKAPIYDQEGRMWAEVLDGVVEIIPFAPSKFPEMNEQALNYLYQNGYVVLSGIASKEEITEAENIFWNAAESTYRVKRGDPGSWTNENWPPLANTTSGVVSNDSSGHSPFMWYVRSLPKIKQAFSQIWKDDDLLVSFDGFGTYRPPELYDSTRSGWFHLDQNGYQKPGLQCVQGLLNLYPSGPEDGGLVVVPNTNNQFDGWFKSGLIQKKKGDFVPLARSPMKEWWGPDGLPIKLCLDPGDFAFWDSRTVHCSHPANKFPERPIERLRRLVAYVCMTPCSKAVDLKYLREKRMEAFQNGLTLNHWPHEYNLHPTDHNGASIRYNPLLLSDYQKELIVGKKGMSKN